MQTADRPMTESALTQALVEKRDLATIHLTFSPSSRYFTIGDRKKSITRRRSVMMSACTVIPDWTGRAAPEIADRVVEALEERRAHDSMRQNARQTIVDEFDLRTICLPAHLRLIGAVGARL
jgi:hypothetical protein